MRWKRAINGISSGFRRLDEAIAFLEDSLEDSVARKFEARAGNGRDRGALAGSPNWRSRVAGFCRDLAQPIEIAGTWDVGTWFQ